MESHSNQHTDGPIPETIWSVDESAVLTLIRDDVSPTTLLDSVRAVQVFSVPDCNIERVLNGK